jgi:hypothetical protein
VSGSLSRSGDFNFTIEWNRRLVGNSSFPIPSVFGIYSATVLEERGGQVVNGRTHDVNHPNREVTWDGPNIRCIRR